MTYYSTITSKGQITLPTSIRKNLNIKSGQKLSITQEEGGKITILSPPNIDEIRKQLKKNLLDQGFTSESLKKMAQNYRNGDGITANLKDKYEQNS